MHFADLSYELGRNARGLHVLASVYAANSLTEACVLFLPFAAEKKLKAKVIKADYAQATELVYVLKPGFWLGMVKNYPDVMRCYVVVASDNKALAQHGIDVLVEEVGVESCASLPLDEFKRYLVRNALEMIMNAPKRNKIVVVE